ncbi:hypothetical protein Taro_043300 [Colocasia esculenta]|uniref:Uncharacterized protein n=1 Tax=Colocasia esculenta TaxID=4460 RepID=A0A843X0E0_COLES|nr:hypothetical protein [Colocasia esculenta]
MGILESKVWEKGDEDGGILSVLKLSYDHLPSHLKQCFAYCSIFPKNYKFDRLELVHLWMAQGFVQTRGRKRMEDVGTEYFNDLLDRSFFQFVDGKFAIHDLMLDLAQLVSHCDQSILEIEGSPPETFLEDAYQLRHLSLSINSTQLNRTSLEGLCRCRGLRTLAFNFHRSIKFQIPRDLFLRLNMLRVLDLSFGGLETLPDSVGILVHLRYLDLRGNNFTRLPESLCHLHLLQTLRLKGCDHINKLPQGFSNLINLRHLEAEPHLLSQVVGFGKLTCLQELASFPISKRNGIKIEDLKDMNELRGMISIRNLQWVSGKEEATQAMLSSKRYLRNLEMSWDGHVGRFELEEEILGALVPPSGLKELSIKCYDGLKFPSWMEQQSLAMLESLCLSQWRNLNSLPLLWQRLPFLKTIELVGCPQLRYLPPLSTALRGLTIDDVGLEELPDFYQPSDESFENSTPSLSILSIKSCPALTSLKQGLLRCHLSHLTVLSIQDCRQLAEWPEGDEFRATLLSVQKELRLSGCPKLKALPAGSTLSASLEKVSVIDCPSVVDGSLFAHLQEGILAMHSQNLEVNPNY